MLLNLDDGTAPLKASNPFIKADVETNLIAPYPFNV